MKPTSHRQLLLSLKYATIEACFSVPMLNLTMPSFPFVIAFAVAALGWGPAAVGLMAALPHLCNFIQPPLILWLRRRMSLHRIMVLGFIFSSLPWGMVALLPFVPPGTSRSLLFSALLTVATLANCVCSVAWSAAIAEVVPGRISGRYFGRRNLIFGFWTLLAVLVAGQAADAGQNSLPTFGWIFAVAGLARLLGLRFLLRMHFPASVTAPGAQVPDWSEYRAPLRDRNYLKLAAFVGAWGFFLNTAQPFYPVFLLNAVSLPVSQLTFLTTVAALGGLLTLRAWGLLGDRFGSKPVMYVNALTWALVALASWSVAGPRWLGQLYLNYLVVGATTAGFQLCQFNLMLKLAPAYKAPHVTVFLALTSLLTALGPAVGGLFLRLAPDQIGVVFGQPVRDFHLLFAGSMIGCLLATHLLDGVREEQAEAPEAVWRSMQRMHVFNPMLTMTTAAQMIFTPRAVLHLTRKSLRTLRRHARVLGDIGGEIVNDGREVLRAPFDRERGP